MIFSGILFFGGVIGLIFFVCVLIFLGDSLCCFKGSEFEFDCRLGDLLDNVDIIELSEFFDVLVWILVKGSFFFEFFIVGCDVLCCLEVVVVLCLSILVEINKCECM